MQPAQLLLDQIKDSTLAKPENRNKKPTRKQILIKSPLSTVGSLPWPGSQYQASALAQVRVTHKTECPKMLLPSCLWKTCPQGSDSTNEPQGRAWLSFSPYLLSTGHSFSSLHYSSPPSNGPKRWRTWPSLNRVKKRSMICKDYICSKFTQLQWTSLPYVNLASTQHRN